MNSELGPTARMWEARVEPGRLGDAVAWLLADVRGPALAAGALEVSVYSARADPASGQPARVVLVTRWRGAARFEVPAAPEGLLARGASWDFREVSVARPAADAGESSGPR